MDFVRSREPEPDQLPRDLRSRRLRRLNEHAEATDGCSMHGPRARERGERLAGSTVLELVDRGTWKVVGLPVLVMDNQAVTTEASTRSRRRLTKMHDPPLHNGIRRRLRACRDRHGARAHDRAPLLGCGVGGPHPDILNLRQRPDQAYDGRHHLSGAGRSRLIGSLNDPRGRLVLMPARID